MSASGLARWQFGITTVYHFLFVPLTIGLSILVAGLQTAWFRTGNPMYRRMTRFWGRLFLINFAMGVVTGIVQEFQFGMNWSEYSRFVGDVFGAPLAMEGLLAFFLESTFLGLWIFGWDRLSPRVHLATIWLAAIGTNISAYFILAANSWMQHPVGYRINPETNRAELTSIWKVLSNSTTLVTFPHVLAASFLTAGLFVLGISAWHLRRGNEVRQLHLAPQDDTALFHRSAAVGLAVSFVAAGGVMLSGHAQAQVMTEQQPMKMAAAEALWDTESSAGFSLFAVGDVRNGRNHVNLQVPNGLSVLATNDPNGTVEGINDIQAEYVERYGPGDYRPNVGLAYWTFRLMIGAGMVVGLVALVGLVQLRRRRLDASRRFLRLAPFVIALPYLANSFGWIFTEMGRQPWAVFGVLPTSAGVSPTVSAASVAVTLVGFTLIYGLLAVVEAGLVLRYAKAGPDPEPTATDGREPAPESAAPALVY